MAEYPHERNCPRVGCPIDPMCGFGACLHGPCGDGTNDPCPEEASDG